jgi:diketogulonate reductase-like aldo/keto reductase
MTRRDLTMESLLKDAHVLADGTKLPLIGFGTYRLNGTRGVQAIRSALDCGYRLIDTAFSYENEGTVGEAIKRSGLKRSELIVTSKLPGRYYARKDAFAALQESLYRTGLDYFDLYLLHWPNPRLDQYVEAWQALIDARDLGLVRSIGVCNFLPEYLERLERETGMLPVVNQVELHPYFNQAEQRTFDAAHGILTEAWSPLGRATAVLHDPLLDTIADKYGKNVGQIVLRWELQLDVLPIPKSSTPSRQASNLDIFDFELSKEDMDAINGLSKPDGRYKGQDPATYEEV